ncbi:hypothetical protein [Rugosimonospora africana]|uniref:Uncharacterized protein n=1 Tax=Rugosimonospora africana TaxID=556532 RepID=A0A8J3QNL6_9ACTN|nr:hypothetical protein [Rugosimonospora africana]GIH14234.1 hypothetical protein Raf01_24060 [Rugosimonospora africana]
MSMATPQRRRNWALAIGGAVAVAAAVAEYVARTDLLDSVKTLIAAAIAVAIGGLAVSLPGITRRGVVIGAFFIAAGVSTWTFTSHPIVIWGVLGLEGIVFLLWSWPWLGRLKETSRLGTAWLGLPYWVFGVIGAVLVGHATVGGQRVAYAGVFALAAMAAVAAARRPTEKGGGDPSVGIAAALLVAIALLLLAGSGSMFDAYHAIPEHSAEAHKMADRFWGGTGLYFQPNALAGLAVVIALRIAPDRAFTWWQRLAASGTAGFVLYLTNSRTPWGVALIAALVHAVMVFGGWRRGDLPVYRRPWLAVLTPFVLLGLVLVALGGSDFVVKSRFGDVPKPANVTTPNTLGSGVTSGRTDTWRQVATDWAHAGVAEKIFGDTRTSRAVVTRANDPGAELNTDNAAVGAFRRGGVLGLAAFLFGVLLLLWRVFFGRRAGLAPPAWFTIASLALVPSIALEDWLLGGTNGGIWILLLAGEAYLLRPGRVAAQSSPELVSAGAGRPGGDVTATPGWPAPASTSGAS